MSEKKKKNVQLAEEKKQNQDSSKAVLAEQTEEAVVTHSAIDISSIDPKKIKLAEDMGVPVGQIIDWVNRTEERMVMHEKVMEQIVKKMPSAEKIVAKIREIGQARQVEYQKRIQQQGAQPKQGGTPSLGDILKIAGMGGEGQDQWMVDMQKSMMQTNLDRMKKELTYMDIRMEQDKNFTQAIKDAIVKNLAAKAVAEVVS